MCYNFILGGSRGRWDESDFVLGREPDSGPGSNPDPSLECDPDSAQNRDAGPDAAHAGATRGSHGPNAGAGARRTPSEKSLQGAWLRSFLGLRARNAGYQSAKRSTDDPHGEATQEAPRDRRVVGRGPP